MDILNLMINKMNSYNNKVCLHLQMLSRSEKKDLNNIIDFVALNSDPEYQGIEILGIDALNASELIEQGRTSEVLPEYPY